jgi:hypothetical protein
VNKNLPGLSFWDLENNGGTLLSSELNFSEQTQVRSSIGDAVMYRDKVWQNFAHKSRKHFTDEVSNTVKWGPHDNVWDLEAKDTTLRGQRAEEIREAYCNQGVLDISSQRQLYWLNIAFVIPKSTPFPCKYDLDWKKVDQVKISNYSKQQAFGWRSTHGKLHGNKDFFRFGLKQSEKCGYCDDPTKSVEHLYTECTYSSVYLHALNGNSS